MLKKLMQRIEMEFVGQPKIWEPVNDTIYYGRMSDVEIESMRARNEAAIQKCIKAMGEKWVLHSAHKVTRL